MRSTFPFQTHTEQMSNSIRTKQNIFIFFLFLTLRHCSLARLSFCQWPKPKQLSRKAFIDLFCVPKTITLRLGTKFQSHQRNWHADTYTSLSPILIIVELFNCARSTKSKQTNNRSQSVAKTNMPL